MNSSTQNSPDFSQSSPAADRLTLRRLDRLADGPAIHRLAELDSAQVPSGALVGAEIGGRLLAAISLTDGSAIADPFARTRELTELLAVRRRQIVVTEPRRGRVVADHRRPELAGTATGQVVHLQRLG